MITYCRLEYIDFMKIGQPNLSERSAERNGLSEGSALPEKKAD
jgi:hypothetical protein